MGDAFDTCSIINVKSGHCSEDCHWCAQSAHYHTQAEAYPLLDVEPCVAESRANREAGIGRIALVASGRGQSDREIERIAQHYEAMHQASDIKLCASMGLLTKEQLLSLIHIFSPRPFYKEGRQASGCKLLWSNRPLRGRDPYDATQLCDCSSCH